MSIAIQETLVEQGHRVCGEMSDWWEDTSYHEYNITITGEDLIHKIRERLTLAITNLESHIVSLQQNKDVTAARVIHELQIVETRFNEQMTHYKSLDWLGRLLTAKPKRMSVDKTKRWAAETAKQQYERHVKLVEDYKKKLDWINDRDPQTCVIRDTVSHTPDNSVYIQLLNAPTK